MTTGSKADHAEEREPAATDAAGTPKRSARGERSVRDIIAAARTAAPPTRSVLLTAGLSLLLLWASFTPVDWGPLAWISLVPLIALVRPTRRPRRFYPALYACGLLYWLATLQWMRLGDPSMYLAWFALATYLAFYFPLFIAITRGLVHRLNAPLYLAAPVVWVALEYSRAHVITGFAWYNLSHTQYRWTELIQVSDMTGAYGVSFLIVMMSAYLATLLPLGLFIRLGLVRPCSLPDVSAANDEKALAWTGSTRRLAIELMICLACFAAVLGYGYLRRSEAKFRSGPRTALIQGNFTASLKHDQSEWPKIFRYHDALTGRAVKYQPDMIVWPETMFRWPIFEAPAGLTDDDLLKIAPQIPPHVWRDPAVRDRLTEMSGMAGAALIIGIEAITADAKRMRQYNSALFIRPDRGISGRYDKMHRVIFGEYIPLQDSLPFLQKMTPFSKGFGIDAGEKICVFNYKGWRLAPIICFEDTVPHLVRQIALQTQQVRNEKGDSNTLRPIDCFVNLTNDGWFHGSSELDQHLITAVFRCVECRTPMVRAVNTGISAFIDGDGVIVEPEVFFDGDADTNDTAAARTSMRDPKTGRWYKQLNAALVHTVPLDDRTSLYVTYGDWFALTCLIAALCGMIATLWHRKQTVAEG